MMSTGRRTHDVYQLWQQFISLLLRTAIFASKLNEMKNDNPVKPPAEPQPSTKPKPEIPAIPFDPEEAPGETPSETPSGQPSPEIPLPPEQGL